MTDRLPDPEEQSLPLQRLVDQLCDQWEADWQAGRHRPIEQYLQEVDLAVRPALLRELTLLQADYCQRAGETRTPLPSSAEAMPTLDVSPGLLPAGLPAPVAGVRRLGDSFSDYELLGEIARGAMGVVYKARQVSLNRMVALKMIRSGRHAGEAEIGRFYREAEAAANLDHPHIVPIYDVGQCNGLPYFTMKLIDGDSLAVQVARFADKPLQTAALMAAVARAVHHAHQRGLLHRDLKPANVLVDASGQPHVTDFGLAKQLNADWGQTQSGQLIGTPSYMAPEQAAGRNAQVTTASDVYGLGAILYELLTSQPPFRGESVLDTLRLVEREEAVPPRQLNRKVPRDLETVCRRCLEKDPRKRYGSAEALAEDLERVVAGEPIAARPAGRLRQAWQWCRRNPLPAGLLLAVSLGSAVGLWHLSRLSDELVRSSALDSAAQQADVVEEVNDMYGLAAQRAMSQGVPVTTDYKERPDAIAVPATFTIDLGAHLVARRNSDMLVRLFSDYPFPTRGDGGPHDDFEWEALRWLRANPDGRFYRFENYQGKPALRYAVARIMRPACIECHKTHKDSPRRDWKEGDVRGVVEIIRLLEHDAVRARQGLRGTFILIAVVAGSLLGVSVLALVVRPRRGLLSRPQPG